jgi:PhnB protein
MRRSRGRDYLYRFVLKERKMPPVPFMPADYHTVTPYLAIGNAKAAIAFYQRAFGAELTMQLLMPDGEVAHAEIRIGNSVLMLSEEKAEWGNRSPLSLGGSPVHLMVYVPDVDAAFARALAAGAREKRPVEDQFYGDRAGTLTDPYGFQWTLATHVEEVSEQEAQRRMERLFAKG